jgi:hypothetical protein
MYMTQVIVAQYFIYYNLAKLHYTNETYKI